MAAATTGSENLRQKVFNYICGRGGIVPFSELLKLPSPLSKMGGEGVATWLNQQVEENQPFFLNRSGKENKHIDSVRLRLRIRLCLTYLKSRTCRHGDECRNFHICKAFIEGNCKGPGRCGLSHSFRDTANSRNLGELGLGSLPDGALKNIIANNLPQVCEAYLEGSCKKWMCSKVHICDKFAQYQCPSEKLPCELSHDLKSAHSSALLRKFGLAGKFSDDVLICHILLPKGRRIMGPGTENILGATKENFNDLSRENKTHFDRGAIGKEGQEAKGKKPKGQKKPDGRKKQESSLEGFVAGGKLHEKLMNIKVDECCPTAHSKVWERTDPKAVSGEFLKRKGPQVKMPKKPQLNPEETGTNKPDEKPQSKKKRERQGKGKKVSATDSRENDPQESFDLIDLSGSSQDPGMSAAANTLSIDEMLSMEAEENTQSVSSPDDEWLAGLANQMLSQGSTLDLLGEFSEVSSQPTSGPNERAIVSSICREYNGTVAFPVLVSRQDLFPCTSQEAEKWLRSKPRKFLLLEDEKEQIDEVSVISLGARLCCFYQTTKGKCSRPICYFLHVCKEFVIHGSCPFGDACKLSHDLHSKHNQPILKKLGIASLKKGQLHNLLINSGPQVCLDYNNYACNKGIHCNKIHVCKDFIKRKCQSEEVCGLVHQLGLSTSHTQRVLAKLHLQSVPQRGILNMLMVCEDRDDLASAAQKKLKKSEHIHKNLDTFICDKVIMGRCARGHGCHGHHHHMPYLWQYKTQGEASQWESFNATDSEAIENIYCDVSQSSATLMDTAISSGETLLIDTGDNSLSLDFINMQAVANFGTVQLRRLSTKSALDIPGAPMATAWIWYWQHDGNVWQMFTDEHEDGSDLQHEIESAFLGTALAYAYKSGNQNYKVFFRNSPMFQQNMDPKSYATSNVQRRPVFQPREDVLKLKREFTEAGEGVAEGSPAVAGPHHALPLHWFAMQETDTFTRVKLHPSSDEFRRVSRDFHQSMKGDLPTVVAVERVQNPFLWGKFTRKREQMKREAGNHDDADTVQERQLFHGLSPSHVDITCKKNFNWRLYGQEAAVLGHGAHFTVDARRATQSSPADEARSRYVFLADVLVGSFALGAPMLLGPPQKCPEDPASDFYDSCVDALECPAVFVVFDADQFYPSFLIRYKLVGEAEGE